MTGPITAFDPSRRSNAQLMADCRRLDYLPSPVLDLTWGRGRFWRHLDLDDLDVRGNDWDERLACEYHDDFRATRWPDNQWPTVVFDPPYRHGGTPSTADFDDRYGLSEYRSPTDLRALAADGLTEALRIASEIVLFKTQDHVSSGVLQPLVAEGIEVASQHGAVLLDSLHVLGGRAQPSGRRQVRARHSYSTLLVFKPPRTILDGDMSRRLWSAR
jgi:hypothetical protein